jgi:hypothetical protein
MMRSPITNSLTLQTLESQNLGKSYPQTSTLF